MTGTLPTPDEVEAFLADPSPDKRERKIDELLAPADLCRLVDDQALRHHRQQRRGSLQDGRQPRPRQPAHWYDWIYRRVARERAVRQARRGDRPGHQPRPGQSYEDYCKEMSAYFRDKDPADFAERETMPYFWARSRPRASPRRRRSLQLRLPRRPARMCPVPQAPVRPVDPGRLQPVHRVLQRRPLRRSATATPRAGDAEADRSWASTKTTGGVQARSSAELAEDGKVDPLAGALRRREPARRPAAPKAGAARPAAGSITPKLLGGEEVDRSASTTTRASR